MILDLLNQDGIHPKKVASTSGGEFASPCPSCGGDDRFRVWPQKNRYWCRQCDKSGDAIQYLRDFRGQSYKDACSQLNIPTKKLDTHDNSKSNKKYFKPRQYNTPQDPWQKKGNLFISKAKTQLFEKEAEFPLQWLIKMRGLKTDTINNANLGWNFQDRYDTRKIWGLDGDKKIWLSQGLVIPCIINGNVVRIRIRRPYANGKKLPRYIVTAGSSMQPMILPGKGNNLVIVESELDALLLAQVTGDLATVVALGSAQGKPGKHLHSLAVGAQRILIALDYDEAGAKASKWWMKTYRRARRWPVSAGKDPGDAFAAGIDLKGWIENGLEISDELYAQYMHRGK